MVGIDLDLWWEARDPSKSDDSGRLSRFVSGLPSFDPVYASWMKSPKTGEPVLPVPLSEAEAEQVLRDNIGRYDDGRTWVELGSSMKGGHLGPLPHDFRKPYVASTSCHVGEHGRSSSAYPNHVFMQLSQIRGSTGRPWRASELRPLMKFARDVWSPAEMCAMFSFYTLDLPKFPDPSWAAGVRTLKPWIGWITYLPPELAARAKYPADVEVETLADGAALVTLCEEPFEKTDSVGMARLHALETALRPIQS